MVDSVANVLLETLRDLLIEEVKFLSGVSQEVKNVESDLRTMHGLLMEADRNRSDSPILRNCIAELKKLALEAENVLETYAVEVTSKKEGTTLKKKLQRFVGILCECYTVHHVGSEIDGISSRLAKLTGELSSISGGALNPTDEEQRRRQLRLRYPHEDEQHFVGMEKDIELLVSIMMDETRRSPSVISICGMGGLGKTTLVRKIYHHQDVQRRFDGRAWVCVTQQFQAETILRDIHKQLVDNKELEINSMGLPELVVRIYNVLEQRKCVIVIDDIWESSHWDILKPAFPKNCKVVLTTRNENIASSQECRVYKLDLLTEDEGWELLGKIALPINDGDDATTVLENRSKSFEDIGRQIVQKCGRLPLVISVIGGILCPKQQILGEWEEVSSKIDSYLRHGEGIESDIRVKQVLDLSYNVLPYYLKPCFLYLACFPEDQEIETGDLYRLWMAEGLISSEEKGNQESLRDVAERYLTELAFRCMVQVEKGTTHMPHIKFKSCRLHDLMRDLCSSKAEAENFVKRIDISKYQHGIPPCVGASIHRLVINIDDDDTTLSKSCMQDLEDLRSFLAVCKDDDSERRIQFQNIVNFENSKHLRILVLNRFQFEGGKLPSTLGKLIHLRYLSLRDCNVDELPQHVCDLPYLHTLDLGVENDSMTLPNLIWKMKRLRHLFLPEEIQVIGGDKLRLEGLNELETLMVINSKTACIADIINLSNLRLLGAIIEEDMDSLSKIADYMSNNRCQLRRAVLIVKSCDLSREEGRNVVKNMLMSPSLVSLDISNCDIGCSFPRYEQGMCHNLVDLTISNLNVVEELEVKEEEEVVEAEMRFGANSFPELKYLNCKRMNIRKWEVEKGAMPKLTRLWINGCRNLEKLPDGLRFIPTLRHLRCVGMSEEFKGRMIRGGENGEGAGVDYPNFSHIPDIVIL